MRRFDPFTWGKPHGFLRRTLRQSRGLRKLYMRLKKRFVSDEELLNTRYVPEAAFSEKVHDVLSGLIDRRGREGIGDYLEFGVFNGTSLSCVYRVFETLDLPHPRFFGFDSFEGLPAEANYEDDGVWLHGQFACRLDVTERFLAERAVDGDRVHLVKGWFENTLTPRSHEQYRLNHASLIMIDCDLYSSAADCLRFVEPLILDEAIIVFDEWSRNGLDTKNLGEARAFREFLERHPELKATKLGGYKSDSLIFSVVRQSSQPFEDSVCGQRLEN